jgi:hypothetical protein
MTSAPGPAASDEAVRRGPSIAASIAAVLAVAVIVFAAAVLRQTGIPKIETLWAEDGAVFLQCAYEQGPLGCLGPYQGYFQLVPRLIAGLAGMVPPEAGPPTVAILAALVAAGSAAVAARAIIDVTSSPLAGLLGGIGLGLVWQAGREVLGNASNVHWVLLCAATIAVVCSWLGARISLWTLALVALAGLTSPFAPLIAALAVGSVALRRPRAWPLVLVAGGTALAQVVVELTSPRTVPPGEAITVGTVLKFLRDEVIGHGFFGDVPMPAGLIVPALIVVALAGVAIIERDRRIAVRISIVVATLVVTGLAVCVASIIFNRGTNPRYAFLPTSLMVAALAVAGGLLAGVLGRRSPTAGRWAPMLLPLIVAVVGVGFALSFRLEARASTGPDVPAEIHAIGACPAGSSATVIISPLRATNPWLMKIPCSRMAPP